jgi:carbon-monoxide dehydrogenase small subunit
MKLTLSVNGRPREVEASPAARLLDVLRGPLGLTGSKEGCGEGECGACTVLLDGDPVNACLVLAGQCEGREIVTVEGLAEGDRLSPLQRAFVDHGGAQCGICTPGMLISAEAYLTKNRGLVTLRESVAGNLCRCTGYQRIVDSIEEAEREGRGKVFGTVGSST